MGVVILLVAMGAEEKSHKKNITPGTFINTRNGHNSSSGLSPTLSRVFLGARPGLVCAPTASCHSKSKTDFVLRLFMAGNLACLFTVALRPT